jgi:hypothetical protein
VNEEPLETVSSGPQLPFDAIQLSPSLARELQLTFYVTERLGCELSLNVLVLRML